MGGKLILILSVAAFIGAAQAVPVELVNKILEYREKCVALSGSDEGYRQIVNSVESVKMCVLGGLNVQQLRLDAQRAASGARKPFFDKYCPKFNESLSCFDDIFEGAAKCVGEDVDRVKEILKDAAHNVLDHVCQNNGQIFFDARKPEYKECIAHLKEDISGCQLSVLTKGTPISRYGEEQCRELDESLECLKRKVEECHAPGIYDIYKVIFNTISEANDCKQYTATGDVSNNTIDGNVSENSP